MEDASVRLVVWALLGLHLAVIASFVWLNARRLWWRNSLAALWRRPRGHLIARVAPDGTSVFAVLPARSSRRGAALVVAGGAMVLTGFAAGSAPAFLAALVPTGVGLLALGAGGRHRAPARIEITAEGLRAGAVALPLQRIISFGADRSAGLPLALPVLAPGPLRPGEVAEGLRQPPRLRTALFDRSHLVTVLSASGGRSVIAGGIDRATAAALVDELDRALRQLRR
ncbi:hypothetical protein V8J36_14130 [Frigidibacter sp. MR17.14]|uniref:hypothetical protein n=1 Tax=Frigidibacter sp. MR17.14 TaxID=3126509 RepID=UPI003012AC84